MTDFVLFNKWIAPLRNKVFLLIGRGILNAVNNAGKTQRMKLTLQKNEKATDVERFQEYGFESYPENGEAVIMFPNGNRDQGIIVCLHDRESRPTDLSVKDVRVYDSRGNKITCKSTGIEIEDKNSNKVLLNNSGIEISDAVNTLKITMTALGITLQSADASGWLPNVLAVDPILGIPHGGPGAGITLLKGA